MTTPSETLGNLFFSSLVETLSWKLFSCGGGAVKLSWCLIFILCCFGLGSWSTSQPQIVLVQYSFWRVPHHGAHNNAFQLEIGTTQKPNQEFYGRSPDHWFKFIKTGEAELSWHNELFFFLQFNKLPGLFSPLLQPSLPTSSIATLSFSAAASTAILRGRPATSAHVLTSQLRCGGASKAPLKPSG